VCTSHASNIRTLRFAHTACLFVSYDSGIMPSNGINRVIFRIDKDSVHFEVGTGFLYIVQMNLIVLNCVI
jgi:hypothetical protein